MNIELNHSKWKMYDFNDIFTEYSKSNTENLEQFTVGKYGLVPKSSEGYSYDVQKHKIFEPNTLLLGIGAEEVGVSTMERGCVSPIYNTFKISDSFDSLFLKYLMPIIISQNKCRISHISTRRNYEIEVSELSKIQIALPPLDIQRKISSLLFEIDNKIENQEKLLKKFKDLKSSLLLKLFPMENKDIPSIRFNGFTDTWEQRKLGETVNFYSGLTYSPNNVVEKDGTLVLRSSNVQNGEIALNDNVYVENKVVNSLNVSKGDIIVVVRNGSRALIGKHAQIKEKMDNTVIGAFMTGIRSDFPSYINALLSTSKFDEEIEKNLGATINQITTGAFKEMNFAISTNSDEKKKIGIFFETLDNLITLHQRKLDKLKEVKSALLDKLLV